MEPVPLSTETFLFSLLHPLFISLLFPFFSKRRYKKHSEKHRENETAYGEHMPMLLHELLEILFLKVGTIFSTNGH